MIWLFWCGVARVAVAVSYLCTVVLRPDLARAAMLPFAIVVCLVAIYDLLARRRRRR